MELSGAVMLDERVFSNDLLVSVKQRRNACKNNKMKM